jgi:hypothetical protein
MVSASAADARRWTELVVKEQEEMSARLAAPPPTITHVRHLDGSLRLVRTADPEPAASRFGPFAAGAELSVGFPSCSREATSDEVQDLIAIVSRQHPGVTELQALDFIGECRRLLLV